MDISLELFFKWKQKRYVYCTHSRGVCVYIYLLHEHMEKESRMVEL